MSSGGTVQVHLSGATDYYEYSSSTGESLLPFNMDIQPRNTPETRITYSNMEVADPYHPILDSVDLAAFQGFDQFGTVTEGLLSTQRVHQQHRFHVLVTDTPRKEVHSRDYCNLKQMCKTPFLVCAVTSMVDLLLPQSM